MRKGPAFIGIGASHAGLSQITTWLTQHDEIADTILAHNFFNTDAFEKKGLSWYETRVNVNHGKTDQLTGDVSSGYLVDQRVPARIAQNYGDTKLFMVIRHPLKRALAAYLAHQTIDKSAESLSAAAYLAKQPAIQLESCYADYLAFYSEYYAPVNLHIIVYEDLVADPLKTMANLYEYLEVKKDFVPKGLRHLVPPPEPPKHPGPIKRTILRVKRLYKKLRERPVGPLFPNEPDIELLLTPEQVELFTASMRPATDRLSHMMGRDMVAVWGLE